MPEDLGSPQRLESGDALQAGVLRATDCALTVDSASQVTVAAGVVWVTNAAGVLVRTVPAPTVLSAIPVAVNNRIDQVVVDSAGAVTRLQGTTDVAGNTLAANPQTGGGRAAIPAGSQLLHDIQVTSAGVLAANRRDRRRWARGGATFRLNNVNSFVIPIDGTARALRLTAEGTFIVNGETVGRSLVVRPMSRSDVFMERHVNRTQQSAGTAIAPNHIQTDGTGGASGTGLFLAAPADPVDYAISATMNLAVATRAAGRDRCSVGQADVSPVPTNSNHLFDTYGQAWQEATQEWTHLQVQMEGTVATFDGSVTLEQFFA